MGVGHVGDVNVVPHAHAVRCRVVGAEHLGALFAAQRLEHQRNQVERARVTQLGYRGAGDVEVAQADCVQPPRPGAVADQPLANQLRLPVRRERLTRGLLGDELNVGQAVGGGAAGKHQVRYILVPAALQQRDHPVDVLPVVEQGVGDRFAHLLLPGDVHDTVHVVVPEYVADQLPVPGAAYNQRCLGYSAWSTGGEIVPHDDVHTVGDLARTTCAPMYPGRPSPTTLWHERSGTPLPSD